MTEHQKAQIHGCALKEESARGLLSYLFKDGLQFDLENPGHPWKSESNGAYGTSVNINIKDGDKQGLLIFNANLKTGKVGCRLTDGLDFSIDSKEVWVPIRSLPPVLQEFIHAPMIKAIVS